MDAHPRHDWLMGAVEKRGAHVDPRSGFPPRKRIVDRITDFSAAAHTHLQKSLARRCREALLFSRRLSLEAFPRRQQHMCARHKTSMDSDSQDTKRYAVQRCSNKQTRNRARTRWKWPKARRKTPAEAPVLFRARPSPQPDIQRRRHYDFTALIPAEPPEISTQLHQLVAGVLQ